MSLPEADQPVLSTLNQDGTRRRIRPRLATGRFLARRRVVAYGLMLLFLLIPYIRLGGKPLILLDLPRRQFTLFGTTFLPTDTSLLMLLLLSVVLSIFLLTALLGRVWCGWACPQTIYLEFLYRPIERLFEGKPNQQRRLDRKGPNLRRLLKGVTFMVISVFVAHTFLAYFVGVDRLFHWVRQSPFDHPAAFAVMAGTSVAMFLDFAWFREQTCIVACPYGRLQSVLLDRQSLIVGYDTRRGEPRGKLKRTTVDTGNRGDCIDCQACVRVCPTGIDIRQGLQMECIGCAQCIDACDTIMDKIKRPRGLIRYTSQDELAGKVRRLFRPRVVVYPLLLTIVVGGLTTLLVRRNTADVAILGGHGAPFSLLPDGKVSNQLRLTVANRSGSDRRYQVRLTTAAMQLIAPRNPLPVAAGKSDSAPLFVLAPRAVFIDGEATVRIRVSDGHDFVKDIKHRLLGPETTGPAGKTTR